MTGSYAQNNEDVIIHNYLKRKGIYKGSVLDIGANDGRTFSNSLFFSLKDWQVYLVEPSPKAYERLVKEYENRTSFVIYPYAIGTEPGKVKFFESGSLIRKNDVALVSTFDDDEKKRWPEMKFEETIVDVITFADLIEKIGKNYFDFISIDAEGFDLKILQQIDFFKISCRVICIEWNGKNEALYWACVKDHGFRLIAKNGENLIYGR